MRAAPSTRGTSTARVRQSRRTVIGSAAGAMLAACGVGGGDTGAPTSPTAISAKDDGSGTSAGSTGGASYRYETLR